MAHAHINRHDQIHCRNELLARALVCKKSIFIGDMVLKYDGVLRAFKLKSQVPVNLQGEVALIPNGTCEDYYRAGQHTGRFYHIEEIFSSDNLYDDFDEVEIGASSWQPKLDAIQEQIDDLDSTYATDAQVVASFATQIAEAGDVFSLVTNKVQVETNRATQAEQQIQDDVDANEAAALADRQDIRADFAAADAIVNQAVVDEAAAARLAEQQIQDDVDANEAAALADRQDIRTAFAAADSILTQAVVDEAALARAAEQANTSAIGVERARIDTIVNLPSAALNNFAAIQAAYEAADQSADSALTNLITSKVAAADLDTLVSQVDAVEANTLKRDNAAQDQRYYQKSDVDSAVGLRVLQTDFDTAIAARQTTVDQEAAYRKKTDSLSKAEAEAADNARVLQTDYDTAIGLRQTTSDADSKYRLQTDSLSKTEAEDADGLRVLQTDFDTAIGLRQTTSDADDKYRLQTDSYDKNEVDTRDGLRVLQTDFDTEIGLRQTTAIQEVTYRKIADSHHKDDVYTKSAADNEFHSQSYVASQLALKQNVVGDDHLQISHTTGLTAALAGKQPTVGDDDLAISHTLGLQSALDGKQASLTSDQQAVVDAHAYSTAEKDKVAENHLKVSYSDASVVSGHTADIAANASAISAKAPKDDPTFTTKVTAPKLHSAELMSQSSHLKLGSQTTNDLNIFLDGLETLQITRSGTQVKYTAHGGSGTNKFNQSVECAGTVTAANLVVSAAVPNTSVSSGVLGEIRVGDHGGNKYIYVCIATDTWRRVSLSTATW